MYLCIYDGCVIVVMSCIIEQAAGQYNKKHVVI